MHTNKHEINLNLKLNLAEKATSKAFKASAAAYAILTTLPSVNGYGIVSDVYTLRSRFLEAQNHIKAALEAINDVDWPTNADYDHL